MNRSSASSIADASRGCSALIVRGDDGLDELSIGAPTRVWVVTGKTVVRETVVDAADLGLPRCALEDLRGGDAAFNAEVVRQTLAGRRGPVRDAVLLNAAAAIAAYDGLDGDLTGALARGLERATRAVGGVPSCFRR
ncbi:anthranilate phosphoribosyltransferase [Streptosporangium album]|uniref:Anthranilate phosphoribosyltransferase n=1 Tax=Streptosporangium album TaxID=47479 RepID=A0A7W7WDM0_9ACTN|nr:hypothetical protein [Streptosporangium album]MBB4943261.1 anthranilate phosphoribosyltransferase [Streptosporangium album]